MSKSYMLLIMVAGLWVACRNEQDATSSAASNAPPATSSGNPADYLTGLGKAKRTADAQLDKASLNKTVQLFHAQEGRYPKDLNELVKPGYLSALPTPPHGMKFDYNRTTGEVKVVPQ